MEPCPAPRLAHLLCWTWEGKEVSSHLLGEKLHLHVLGKGLSVLDLQTSTETGNLEAESEKASFSHSLGI